MADNMQEKQIRATMSIPLSFFDCNRIIIMNNLLGKDMRIHINMCDTMYSYHNVLITQNQNIIMDSLSEEQKKDLHEHKLSYSNASPYLKTCKPDLPEYIASYNKAITSFASAKIMYMTEILQFFKDPEKAKHSIDKHLNFFGIISDKKPRSVLNPLLIFGTDKYQILLDILNLCNIQIEKDQQYLDKIASITIAELSKYMMIENYKDEVMQYYTNPKETIVSVCFPPYNCIAFKKDTKQIDDTGNIITGNKFIVANKVLFKKPHDTGKWTMMFDDIPYYIGDRKMRYEFSSIDEFKQIRELYKSIIEKKLTEMKN